MVAGEEIRGHVALGAKGGLKLLEREEDFLIICTEVLLRLDIDRANLPAVLASGPVGASDEVGVIEAESCRAGHKRNASHAVGGDVRGALFGGAVHLDRQLLAMPVQLLGGVGVVVDLYPGGLAFLEPEQRSRELPVVDGGGHHSIRRQLDRAGADAQRVVGLAVRRRRRWSRTPLPNPQATGDDHGGGPAPFQEIAPRHRHDAPLLTVVRLGRRSSPPRHCSVCSKPTFHASDRLTTRRQSAHRISAVREVNHVVLQR